MSCLPSSFLGELPLMHALHGGSRLERQQFSSFVTFQSLSICLSLTSFFWEELHGVPRKMMEVVGPTDLSSSTGVPVSLQTCLIMARLFAQLSCPGGPSVIQVMKINSGPALFCCMIHCSASATAVKIRASRMSNPIFYISPEVEVGLLHGCIWAHYSIKCLYLAIWAPLPNSSKQSTTSSTET